MNIVTLDNETILRENSTNLTQEDFKTLNLGETANKMLKLMIENNGVGISAPQIGINKRFFLAYIGDGKVELVINPVIINKSEEMNEDNEGCLSVPNKHGNVLRHEWIEIKYFNGKEIVQTRYEGFPARVMQHEYDHLDGILYIDKATEVMNNEVVKSA